ncbi:MAG: IS110 family transposase [Clostridiales bacterium]|nr:IS110 family transposase [Clostridiales bacterium]
MPAADWTPARRRSRPPPRIAKNQKNPLNVEVKAFKAPPGDLQRLIEDHGCRGAAMEGAGAYWRPACGVLEGAFGGGAGVIAANARDMRSARGKKSGGEDALRIPPPPAGALKGSFTPEASARDLRDPARRRKHIAQDVCAKTNRLERPLQRKGLKLPAFSADAAGASGRNSPGALRGKGGISPGGIRGGLKKRCAEPGKGKLFAEAGRLGCTPPPASNLAQRHASCNFRHPPIPRRLLGHAASCAKAIAADGLLSARFFAIAKYSIFSNLHS